MGSYIAVLPPQVAAKIAAGEVIERPSAVVRELLDNAIDAGASQVSLYLEDGGLQLIRVNDDGLGMNREDLELCYLPHATSKIRQTDDLLKLCSLGFRGEALGSIAACSKLRINSAQESLKAYELRVADSLFQSLEETSMAQSGTQVEVRELFYSFPARRKFLKSIRSELASCKAVFQERALAFPHIHFRLYNQGKMDISLAPGSILERICQIFNDLVPEQLCALNEQAEYFSLELFAAPPAIYRRDRKRMPIYINQRPIAETSLQQAIRIGFDGYLAGGLFPVCFCFMQVVSGRVDFNIHPAKREARLRDLSQIQASIRQTLRSFCRDYGKLSGSNQTDNQESSQKVPQAAEGTKQLRQTGPQMGYSSGPTPTPNQKFTNNNLYDGSYKLAGFSARDLQHVEDFEGQSLSDSFGQIPSRQAAQLGAAGFRYFGQLFEVFLLVERNIDGLPQLLIVDQHASHERILYETLEQDMLQKQPLLVPIELEVEPKVRESLHLRSAALASIGIQLEESDSSTWHITCLPPSVSDLKEQLIDLVLHGASEAEDLKRELFAHLSCCKAIKKGDVLDDLSATELLRNLFAKGLERCPHGRPLWYSLSQQELYRLLQRT